jgi:hypothetical protein
MATPLNENFDQACTEERLMQGAAGSAGVIFAESPFEISNSRFYHSEKKRTNVQHFLQATSETIGKKRHRF